MSSGCDILLEDGSGGLLLENGDDLLLENCVPAVATAGGNRGFGQRRQRVIPRLVPVTLSIDAVIRAPTVTMVLEINDDEVVMELLASIL